MTDAQGQRRPELIDRALAEAGRIEEKESRLNLLRQVADRWLELGLVDRATPILRQGRAIIASLPRDQVSIAAEEFAEVLAVIDLRTAKTILERKDPKDASPATRGRSSATRRGRRPAGRDRSGRGRAARFQACRSGPG